MAPPAGAVRRHRRLEPGEPVGVEAVAGLVEQPQRRAGRHHPRQRRALALAGREHPDRHVGKRRQAPSPPCPAAPSSDPEAERAAEPLPLVEREMLVGERGLGALDGAGGGPQQPGGEADQARICRPRWGR